MPPAACTYYLNLLEFAFHSDAFCISSSQYCILHVLPIPPIFLLVPSLPEEYTVQISSLCNWLHYLITFFLLGPRVTFNLCTSLCVLAIVRAISHLSRAKNEIRVSVCFNLKALVCKSFCGRNYRRTFCCILVTKSC